jgi:tetratricopeptide (TPR) repeat protein
MSRPRLPSSRSRALAAAARGLALSVASALALSSLPTVPTAAAAPTPSTLWGAATADPEASIRATRYAEAMHLGHELGRAALASDFNRSGDDLPPSTRLIITNRAAQAFRDAAQIDPTAADPHYYLALLIMYGRLECRGCDFEPRLATEALAAIDAFEARAPLDPRLGISLFTKRAIYHTRLAGFTTGDTAKKHLEIALVNYRITVERHAATRADSEVVYGNMAETLMMLGDVEEAIEQYRQALRVRPSTGVTLGLAVALDRDERGTEARSLLRDLGTAAIGEWELSVSSGDTFYVPEGEVYYYRALINETFGNVEAAIDGYDRFIQSRAHPQFTPRAIANRNALRARLP